MDKPEPPRSPSFSELDEKPANVFVDMVRFLRQNRKLWLLPMLIVLLLLGLLIVLSSSAVAPFIYTLF